METNPSEDKFKKVEGIRVREVDEWSHCLIFTPKAPALISLNLDAWLIFELCDSKRSVAEISHEYREGLSDSISAAEAERRVIATLKDLQARGVVEEV